MVNVSGPTLNTPDELAQAEMDRATVNVAISFIFILRFFGSFASTLLMYIFRSQLTQNGVSQEARFNLLIFFMFFTPFLVLELIENPALQHVWLSF